MSASNNSLPEAVENAGVAAVVLAAERFPEIVVSMESTPQADSTVIVRATISERPSMRENLFAGISIWGIPGSIEFAARVRGYSASIFRSCLQQFVLQAPLSPCRKGPNP